MPWQVAPGRLPASLRVDAVIVDVVEDQLTSVDAADVHGLLNAGGVLVLVASLSDSQVGVTKNSASRAIADIHEVICSGEAFMVRTYVQPNALPGVLPRPDCQSSRPSCLCAADGPRYRSPFPQDGGGRPPASDHVERCAVDVDPVPRHRLGAAGTMMRRGCGPVASLSAAEFQIAPAVAAQCAFETDVDSVDRPVDLPHAAGSFGPQNMQHTLCRPGGEGARGVHSIACLRSKRGCRSLFCWRPGACVRA